ncbi:MAG TPA: iron-containing redox enzyme family protein [Solirubrobacteraceae bacterium]|nr:iron-containing redox enzyme family protein [Solirubrobacteraceae bacterium]
MDVLARIDEARRQYNVLEHPFYQRWSAGELSAEELGFYAGEYRHAVVALASASEAAAAKAGPEHRAGLERHAAEERDHVAMWDEFAAAAAAAAAGAESGREPLCETEGCVRAWVEGESLLEHLAVLYAVEASQPAIAQTKLDGLLERYGYTPEGPAVEYFELHAVLDVEHARQARELIERLIGESDEAERSAQAERMVQRATAALRGNWELLDGVERHFVPVG